MIFLPTKFEHVYIIELEQKLDERGSFIRFYCQEEFAKSGLECNIVQANRSLTRKKGTIRGMHFQKFPKAEDKIIQCLRGVVYDVIIDLRRDALTYGQWMAVELSEQKNKMLFVPKGFAHGFQTLTDNCEMQYCMSEFYSPDHSAGVRWNDQFFNIKWPIEESILSEKDKDWPSWEQ